MMSNVKTLDFIFLSISIFVKPTYQQLPEQPDGTNPSPPGNGPPNVVPAIPTTSTTTIKPTTSIALDSLTMDFDSFCAPAAAATYLAEVLHKQETEDGYIAASAYNSSTKRSIAEKKWKAFFALNHLENLCNPNKHLECITEQAEAGEQDEVVISSCKCNPMTSTVINDTICVGTLGAPCKFKSDAYLLKPRLCDTRFYQCEDIRLSDDSEGLLKIALSLRVPDFFQNYMMDKTTHICHCIKGTPSVAGLCIGNKVRGDGNRIELKNSIVLLFLFISFNYQIVVPDKILQ